MMESTSSADAELTGEIRQEWGSGGVVDMRIDARRPLADWTVEVDLGGAIVSIWNATVQSVSGTTYVLGPADYNAQVPAGSTIEFGVETDGGIAFAPQRFTVRLAEDAAAESAAAIELPTPPAPDPAPEPEAEAAEAANPPSPPALSVSDITVDEGGTAAPRAPAAAPTPFATSGTRIVDADGEPVALHGINWFGLETEIFVPHGLWARNWREMMDEIRELGFNALRLPLSGELVASGGGTPSGIDYALNPDLVGLNGLEILDAIVAYANTIGLYVVLDYHRGSPGAGPNENGLWYGAGRTEADVIAEWQALAERYADAPAVIGADLINEPHMATWGDGSATDWAAAAERIGNAVLQVAPHWLIVVEGIADHAGETYWWGGNLRGVRERPVQLQVEDRLVYSPHDYPPSVHDQAWFRDGRDLTELFSANWGFIVEEGIAPVLLGEWGSRLVDPRDEPWADALSAYLDRHDIPWLWWAVNPNSEDTGGLYAEDWATVRPAVTALLDRFLLETLPAAEQPTGEAVFTVALAEPAEDDLVLKYATTDGTAQAGLDYAAVAGTLTFEAGTKEQTVRVPLLPDAVAEGEEYFYLVVGGSGAVRGAGSALIVDAGGEASRRLSQPLQLQAGPFVDVLSTVIAEPAEAPRFRLVLSEPAERDVTVSYVVQPEGGGAAARGSVTIAAGEREAVLEPSLAGEAEAAPERRYSIELTAADGAAIRTGAAEAVVAAPAAAPQSQLAISRSATAEAQLTVDLILQNDWGSGALFNVIVKNVSGSPVSDWQISLDLPFDLAEIWSAVLVADEGERVTLGAAEWNGTIAPGASVDFGFIADAGDIALQSLLAGADLELLAQ